MTDKETSAGEELLVLHEKWVRAARAHLREIVAAVVGLILLLSFWSGYRMYQNRREGKAALLYAQALSLKDRNQAFRKLEELVKRYPGTVAAREARLNLWERDLSTLAPEKLLPALKKIERENRGEVKTSVLLGEAYLRETQGRVKESVRLYEKVLKEAPYAGEIVYADLARAYEALKDYRKALEYYRKYLKTRPPSGGLNFVEYKLNEIKKRLASPGS
ncbi:tetratricopeptide repeat protein [Thermosulfurimonas sp. F29]|uniref:tetratricopeptide repeat protein n=1 Tax=Thermosulfurimonas sp. F29 TaxID=2867247 RepID=UPI001C82CFE3|nr:tetratricopeptide repeat protein [Thermosulfurimonas sp. F29]MBX6422981.1 tetratricopeptide repeat protein [Thermosulfurimonas sp. F29]